MSNRRDFIKKTTLLGLAGIASNLIGNEKLSTINSLDTIFNGEDKYTLPELSYSYSALAPSIDEQTMTIHHTKHHQGYVDKLNKALESYKGDKSLKSLFDKASKLDHSIKNNAGGHFNHTLFWQIMAPSSNLTSFTSKSEIGTEIIKSFNSFENFKNEFSSTAGKIFGSGWCWLIEQNGKLKITISANQDNPLMDCAQEKGRPLLALDIWEHAYYLNYQNKRADYITNWWNVVNWKKANELYLSK